MGNTAPFLNRNYKKDPPDNPAPHLQNLHSIRFSDQINNKFVAKRQIGPTPY
jgi:hypothetical protein